ncbi:hypothetical protein SeMB42_g03521 [Synchytrium endobioticum]|uniref:NADH dehydrogenase [ubiquinone] 1 beta subcomplex subunit 11, mitochondrial n=1 Tax=Synchytrium endobioticum TaxID=286115 RepID=A0A507DJ67_9FUNG|nr:hypothetical protein SeMB42_g03521 [Synchytrium endobioticum]TPX51257.1 hypothetical protein SeLEV6574_g00382 [Synchytrium endobioticum]
MFQRLLARRTPSACSALLLYNTPRPLFQQQARLASGVQQHGHGDSASSSLDHHRDDHHHLSGAEPSGYLFGEAPAQKRTWYWWESFWYFGYLLPMGIWIVFMVNRTDGPTDAAKIEAHRRLASRGESFRWPLPPDYADKSAKQQ